MGHPAKNQSPSHPKSQRHRNRDLGDGEGHDQGRLRARNDHAEALYDGLRGLMLTVLGGLAEFERDLIRAYIGGGWECAKRRGL